MKQFTMEEINLIYCFKEKTKIGTISDIAAAIPYMERDIGKLAGRAVEKLTKLSEEEFAQLIFEPGVK